MICYCIFNQVVPKAFWSEELCGLLLSCIMDPASVGFDMSDVEVVAKLPEEVRNYFAVDCVVSL